MDFVVDEDQVDTSYQRGCQTRTSPNAGRPGRPAPLSIPAIISNASSYSLHLFNLLGSRMIVWLSPLHRRAWTALYSELEQVPYHVAPNSVAPDNRYGPRLQGESTLVVEGLHPFRSSDLVLE